jgi:hypothetical protein
MSTLTLHARDRLMSLPCSREAKIAALECALSVQEGAVCKGVRGTFDNARDQWAQSDVLALIVRNGRIVSAFLTRKGQVNTAHLRVERIVWA